MRKRNLRNIIMIPALLLWCGVAIAQTEPQDPLTTARNLVAQQNYSVAIDMYQTFYEQNKQEEGVYGEYLQVLLTAKEYKKAERIIDERKKLMPGNPLPYIDMGRVYLAMGKEKKANDEFDEAFKYLNGDDMLTQLMAKRFRDMHKDDLAIKTYEQTRHLLQIPSMYSGPLSRLYTEQGNIEQAISVMLATAPMGFMLNNTDDTKAGLLDIIGNDPKKLQTAQKTLIKLINEQPQNSFYSELLTWLYTQKDDWDGALIQAIALDERNKEQGSRILNFAQFAAKTGHYDIAIKAYDEVIDKGASSPGYIMAKAEKLSTAFEALEDNPEFKKEDAQQLAKQYETFFAEAPQYKATEIIRDYARLEAQYIHDVPKAISTLEQLINEQAANRNLIGEAKLQLGDYYVLIDKIWDATLLYSQVDKTFREDILGEEARFRNAKLAYYRNDFGWAQTQLTVLKASTSELIANDALYLSILITENIPPDSNMVPLQRYAYADLLLFQNKDKEAEALLDSIAANFPEHPLKDDILMQKATLAQKHREYDRALALLKEVYEKYGKDVLGDDAVFRTATIYEKYLKKPDEAKKYYEQLIIDYPGSTYVQTARNKLNALQAGTPMP